MTAYSFKKTLLVTSILLFSAIAATSEPTAPEGWTKQESIVNKTPEPIRGKSDTLSGFIPYSRNYMDPLYETTLPNRDEITSHFHVSLAREECEPLAFDGSGKPKVERLVQHLQWAKEVREGIDDAEYLYAFQKAMDHHNQHNTKFAHLIERLKTAIDSTRMATKNPRSLSTKS